MRSITKIIYSLTSFTFCMSLFALMALLIDSIGHIAGGPWVVVFGAVGWLTLATGFVSGLWAASLES